MHDSRHEAHRLGHLEEKKDGSPEPWIEIENCDDDQEQSREVLIEK